MDNIFERVNFRLKTGKDFAPEMVKELLAEIRHELGELQYIDLDDITPFAGIQYRYCPSCGYKEADGHWKDCELFNLLNKLEE